jgi:hypothetical protein
MWSRPENHVPAGRQESRAPPLLPCPGMALAPKLARSPPPPGLSLQCARDAVQL